MYLCAWYVGKLSTGLEEPSVSWFNWVEFFWVFLCVTKLMCRVLGQFLSVTSIC